MVFIMKDSFLHRQEGIHLTTAKSIIEKALFRDEGPQDTTSIEINDGGNSEEGHSHLITPSSNGSFTFATLFLSHPFTVFGFKINLRRYVVSVCDGSRLRVFVHDDGKNIYTPKPYRDPWDVVDDADD